MDTNTVTAYATLGLLFFTFILALFTCWLGIEAWKTRKLQHTPRISLIMYPLTGLFIALKIKNTGSVDAKDVSIRCLNGNIYDYEKKKYIFSDHLSKKYSYIAKNQEYSYTIGYFDKIKSEQFKFAIECTSVCGIKNEYEIEIIPDQFEKSLIDKDYEKNIAESLSGIHNSILSVIEGSCNKGIRVNTRSESYFKDRKIDDEVFKLEFLLERYHEDVQKLLKSKQD